MTDHLAVLASPLKYHLLTSDELEETLADLVIWLSQAMTELGVVKSQYLWLYYQGYKASQETSVAGRDRDGEMSAMAVKEDELTLESQITGQLAIRDLLVTLLGRRA